jgi:hypothetical protein
MLTKLASEVIFRYLGGSPEEIADVQTEGRGGVAVNRRLVA